MALQSGKFEEVFILDSHVSKKIEDKATISELAYTVDLKLD